MAATDTDVDLLMSPCRLASVAFAREWVCRGVAGKCPLSDDAETITSELVTNAILYNIDPEDGHYTVGFRLDTGHLMIQVGNFAKPGKHPVLTPGDADDLDVGGRGLNIVDALTQGCWNYEENGIEVVVRAHLYWGEPSITHRHTST